MEERSVPRSCGRFFENILPYLGIEKEAAQETDAVRTMDQVEHLLSAE